MTKNEAAVAHLTAEVDKTKRRIDAAAVSGGAGLAIVKRTLAQLEQDLEKAKGRAALDLHSLPAAVLSQATAT